MNSPNPFSSNAPVTASSMAQNINPTERANTIVMEANALTSRLPSADQRSISELSSKLSALQQELNGLIKEGLPVELRMQVEAKLREVAKEMKEAEEQQQQKNSGTVNLEAKEEQKPDQAVETPMEYIPTEAHHAHIDKALQAKHEHREESQQNLEAFLEKNPHAIVNHKEMADIRAERIKNDSKNKNMLMEEDLEKMDLPSLFEEETPAKAVGPEAGKEEEKEKPNTNMLMEEDLEKMDLPSLFDEEPKEKPVKNKGITVRKGVEPTKEKKPKTAESQDSKDLAMGIQKALEKHCYTPAPPLPARAGRDRGMSGADVAVGA